MNFRNLDIKQEYRSFQDNIIEDFYCQVLNLSNKYQRAVGFFSSSALIEISRGIKGLIDNGGNIELIASPKLSEEDVDAINKGIKKREEIVEKSIIESICEPINEYEEQRLDFLINLIAYNRLEIKIALLEEENEFGMYHEKMGLMYDCDGNTIAFSGSMNESVTAMTHNYEAFDVYKSWGDESERKRVENKRHAFSSIWNDYEPKIHVVDFPKAAEEKLFQFRKTNKIDTSKITEEKSCTRKRDIYPSLPEWLILREYQKEAINNWKEKNYVGIFDMATGTGKTLTGLSAITELYNNRKVPLAIFIVCPYQHLVTQWVEDILNFNIKPIICFSDSPQKNWHTKLKNECFEMEMGLREHLCAIFTNATYSTDKVQKIIEKIKSQSVLVIDEAHNFGAENLSRFLDKKIPYRLALSATIERQGDDLGTKKLFEYFEEKCIEYTLKEAIENDMLVPYFYHPIVVNFDEDELDAYLTLSKKIGKAIAGAKDEELSSSAKLLLIKRARIVAAARGKVRALMKEIEKYKEDNHILVYCGATTMKDIDYREGQITDDEERQLDIVMRKLGIDMEMKVAKFTSEEKQEKRENLKREFDKGDNLQALIAIRCLDEGVNIPSIDKAFLLASSTNPKEYIQRRGRVLRKYPGKTHSDIYDFILSPLPLDSINGYSEDIINTSKSLVKKEIIRMKDFANLAENPSVADNIIFELINNYDIDMEKMEENYE